MPDVAAERPRSPLEEVSTALVRLHKEQFGRGPSYSRAYFAGPDMLVCELRHALLPAERRMVQMGDKKTVADTRTSYQAATRREFIDAIQAILHREVIAFASAIDPENDVIYENFSFARVSQPGTPEA
ncbi:MAG TPA: Na-translocating system protein MpsC family protein [Solirubrobacteraceae bacterium]|jgi:uncharacterized protein YbcI